MKGYAELISYRGTFLMNPRFSISNWNPNLDLLTKLPEETRYHHLLPIITIDLYNTVFNLPYE